MPTITAIAPIIKTVINRMSENGIGTLNYFFKYTTNRVLLDNVIENKEKD